MRRVQLATNCNNRCVFCAQSSAFHGESDAVERFVVEPGPAGDVVLVGGEPTLVPDLESVIAALRTAGSKVSMQTNARLLGTDPQLAPRLHAAGLVEVEVALHGPTAAVHDYHTQVPGSFRETLTGVRSAVAAGIRVVLTSLVTRSNFRHLSEWVRLASVAGVREAELRSVLPYGRAANKPRLEPPHELATPHIRAAMDLAKRLGVECRARAADTDDFALSGAELGSQLISIKKLVCAHVAQADSPTYRLADPGTGEWSPA